MIESKLIARVNVLSKDLYVSDIYKADRNKHKVVLSESIHDAMFLGDEEIKAVAKLFSFEAHYIRLDTTENDVSALVWSQLSLAKE